MTATRIGLLILLAATLTSAQSSIETTIPIPHTRMGGITLPEALVWDAANQTLFVGGKGPYVLRMNIQGSHEGGMRFPMGPEEVKDLFLHEQTARLFVLCRSGMIYVFSTSTGQLVTMRNLWSEFHVGKLLHNPVRDDLLCLGASGAIHFINLATLMDGTIPVPGWSFPPSMCLGLVNVETRRVFFRNQTQVRALNASTYAGEGMDFIPFSSFTGGGMTYDSQRQRLVVSSGRFIWRYTADIHPTGSTMLNWYTGRCAYDPEHDVVWCLSSYDNKLRVLNGASMSVRDSLSLPGSAGSYSQAILVDTLRDRVYASGYKTWILNANTLSVVGTGIGEAASTFETTESDILWFAKSTQPYANAADITTGRLIRQKVIGMRPTQLYIEQGDSSLWIRDAGSRVIALVDIDRAECQRTVILPTSIRSFVQSPVTDMLYVGCADGLYRVNPANMALDHYPKAHNVQEVIAHPTKGLVYCFCDRPDKVMVFNEHNARVEQNRDVTWIGSSAYSYTFYDFNEDEVWYLSRSHRTIASVKCASFAVDSFELHPECGYAVAASDNVSPNLIYHSVNTDGTRDSIFALARNTDFNPVAKAQINGAPNKMVWHPFSKLILCSGYPWLTAFTVPQALDGPESFLPIQLDVNGDELVCDPHSDRAYVLSGASSNRETRLTLLSTLQLGIRQQLVLPTPSAGGCAFYPPKRRVCVGDREHSSVIVVRDEGSSDFGVFPGNLPFPMPLVSRGKTSKTLTVTNDGDRAMSWAVVASPPRPWLQIGREGANPLPPGKEAKVMVTVDASRLPEALYPQLSAEVLLTSDDPNLPLVEIPVTVTREKPEKPEQGKKTEK